MQEITGQQDFIKIKDFCSTKDSVKKMREEATEWEKTAKDTSDKGPLSKTCKNLLKFRK